MDLRQNKFGDILNRISVVFVFFVLIYFPFSELCLHALLSYTHLSEPTIFWLAHFYEPLLILIFLGYMLNFILCRRLPKFEKADWLIFTFLLFAVTMVFSRFSDLSRGLQGLRFLALPYGIYILARLSDYKNPNRLLKIYLLIGVLAAMIGVAEYLYLPRGYLSNLLQISDFGFGENSLISIGQATAFLAGPNQLASYLILPFFYILHRFITSKFSAFWDKNIYILFVLAAAIFVTYSRSALVGVVIATTAMMLYFFRNRKEKITSIIILFVSLLTLAFVYALQSGEFIRDILTHGSSFSQHLLATKSAFLTFVDGGIIKILFGYGVGSAGPAALKLGGIVSENYYLQVLFEVGIIGFAIFLFFIFYLIKNLWTSSKTLFFAFLALLVNAIFLHIFSDNPAMAVSVFAIIGVVLNWEKSSNF